MRERDGQDVPLVNMGECRVRGQEQEERLVKGMHGWDSALDLDVREDAPFSWSLRQPFDIIWFWSVQGMQWHHIKPR